ncbi:substrate-binding domain-containing protein [Nostoc sp. FACHB-87]|uniref:substrate-binding domain-containing protein n=1 Tax=Nostocaceae TaxID=1162 RepID=UPI0016893D94|nr:MULTISPECIES: substrate-binding domain-containing protein [Nostocaceae]MBD2458200.1 substrate-binding domain-containing protein [Nostoc sp. FACHB-87]MBD2480046.1 substrate-binding domain-containing protein [Anabaena sp. FACHB-83]
MVQRRLIIAALASCLAIVTADTSNLLIPQVNAQSARNRNVIVAMTTSIEDSGLLDDLVPAFEKKTGYRLKKVAVGTGKALALAEKGEVDALFVNSPKAERKVLQGGAVTNRRLVMHNDFVIVGPGNPDKAKIRGNKNAVQAFNAIAKNQALFVSRGDDSGTNKLEKDLWQQANIKPAGVWYQQTGSGMARTLQVANQKLGYTLADRATYIFQKKNLTSLQVLVEGDRKLLNLYHVMQVNPQKFPRVNSAGSKAFIDFVLSPEGQRIIAAHGRQEFGQPLFFVDGGKSEKDYGF